jgi:RimJ/RimL family protein N-acetyltransferase
VSGVRLREVDDADLDAFFEHQLDPSAVAQAVATARDRAEFDAWWARVRANPQTVVRTVVEEEGEAAGRPVGWIASFAHDGHVEIGGWGGRRGQGIGSQALEQFLVIEQRRPIRSGTHPSNAAARRVLERAGFREIGIDEGDGFVLYELGP